jgi:hypothetical protein
MDFSQPEGKALPWNLPPADLTKGSKYSLQTHRKRADTPIK